MRRYLPSPALFVSLIALFVAFGGVGYAKGVIHFINGSTIKKGTIQVDRLSAKARAALKGSTGAPGAQGPAGTPGAPGAGVTKLFGDFEGEEGKLVHGSGIESSEKAGTGFYVVHFKQDITQCVLFAAPSSKDNTNPTSVTVGAAYYTEPNSAFVLIRKDFADERVNAAFSLMAVC